MMIAGVFLLEGAPDISKVAAAATALIVGFAASILILAALPATILLSLRGWLTAAWALAVATLLVASVLLHPFSFARMLSQVVPISH
jgi:hypothetical protein